MTYVFAPLGTPPKPVKLSSLLSGVLTVVALLAAGGSLQNSDDSAPPGGIVVFLVFFYLACPYFESKWGATPGKMMVGLQITDKDGNRLSFRRAFVRNFFRSISFYLYCFIIPAIYQFSRFKQTRKLSWYNAHRPHHREHFHSHLSYCGPCLGGNGPV
jgi:uncharacterized RDD family membrane protein YckC